MNLPLFENIYSKAGPIYIIFGSLVALIHASNFSNDEKILCKLKSYMNIETCFNIKNQNGLANLAERNGRTFVSEGTLCETNISPETFKIQQCVKGQWIKVQDKKAWIVHRSKRNFWDGSDFNFNIPSNLLPNRNPSVTCPSIPLIYYADKGEVSVAVWWNQPNVSDPDGDTVSVSLSQGSQPGVRFEEGSYTISYMAQDNRGAAATCSFAFNVIVRRCPNENTYIDRGSASCQPFQRNIYGAQCEYRCDVGYELTGATRIQCESNSQWTAPKPVCRPITCQAPPVVEHGQFTCGSGGYSYLSTCYLSCEAGYAIERDSSIRCQVNKQWTCAGFCTVKRCPYYQPIENAAVSCSHDNAYGSECISVCNQGYQMVGANSQTCQENQTWSGTKPACNYIEAPQFTKGCTRDFEVIAAAVRQRNYVRFTLPEAVDNSGEGVVITSNPISGSDFPLGASRVVVSATDSTGNQANCSFSITVKSISCDAPNVNTSAKNVIVYDCPDQFVYGASCFMHCSNGDQIIGSNRMTCDKTRNSTQLDWKIDGNSFPFCNPQSCSKLNSPDNGALACNTSDGASEVCIVMCNNQYTYPYQAPFKFSCSKRTGIWLPNNTVQSCVKIRKPIAVTTELQFYYYTGSCSNDSATIKDKFLQALGVSIFRDACSEDSPCSVDTVELSCGAVVRRKRRDTSNITFEFKISVVINIGEYKDLGDDEKTSKYYDDIVMGINAKIQTKADAGLLNVQSIGTFNKIEYGQVGLKCEPGTKMAQRVMACAGCGAGYMFINETESCQACPVGTYQDQDVAFSCTPCPDGQTTKDKGSTDLTQCLDTGTNIVLISAAISAGAFCVLIGLFLTFFIYKRMRKRSIKT
ncbi:sushi, von Willebrand factor type A, EGF and pentraxin domain-containing protein 1-like isoform X2 [Physella acuta]|uniref:sushi, von Willebrand factor type A, EGF and pentraxin domain-containing protein 1-like isoform X2 n=1 Tax=Physella acuta TaxID=109671 RepID=UPI0027DD88DF|nr:sushi, von Willebrand factor type A, EGF and pentraxin domain-containing protein 1-like isoform X2 [Physella acuta]